MADNHTGSAPDEEGAAAETLNGPEGDGGGADVDDGEDHGDQKWVIDCVEGLEENGGVVEDEVNTSPLLHHSRERVSNLKENLGNVMALTEARYRE